MLRLLDKDKLMLDMTKLGFEAESLEKFKRAISNPYGMVLVRGRPVPVRRTPYTPLFRR